MTSSPQGMVIDFDNGGIETQIGNPDLDALPIPAALELADSGVIHDPDAINAAAAAALSSEEAEDIEITGPPDGSVRLIAGYIDADGRRHTHAQVRELRGRDEEQIARALATGDLVRYTDAIIRAGLTELGDLDVETASAKEMGKAADSLLIGDRDLLVLQIRRLAYGDTIRLNVTCPYCESRYKVDYSFSEDVPLRPFEVDDTSQRAFELELPSGGTAVCRLVDGKAQKAVFTSENKDKNDEEFNTLLLAEVIDSLNGRPVRGPSPVLDMSSRDRRFLLRWLVETQPGPQYDGVEHECEDCLKMVPLQMSLMSMFRSD